MVIVTCSSVYRKNSYITTGRTQIIGLHWALLILQLLCDVLFINITLNNFKIAITKLISIITFLHACHAVVYRCYLTITDHNNNKPISSDQPLTSLTGYG